MDFTFTMNSEFINLTFKPTFKDFEKSYKNIRPSNILRDNSDGPKLIIPRRRHMRSHYFTDYAAKSVNKCVLSSKKLLEL